MEGLDKAEGLLEKGNQESFIMSKGEETMKSEESLKNLRQKIGKKNVDDKPHDTSMSLHSHDNSKQVKNHKHRPDPLDTMIRRFRRKYDKADFGIGLLTSKSYLIGLCVLFGGNFFLFPLLFIIKRRYGKGRLD